MNILAYTFRTFPSDPLQQYNSLEVFVFGRLHEDLEIFEEAIRRVQPDIIIGFALSDISRQETMAVNRFNKNSLEKGGKRSYDLTRIPSSPFPNATKTTHSFCNWTMYKLAKNHSIAFYHVRKDDVTIFLQWLQELSN